jgi:hypothetical protein
MICLVEQVARAEAQTEQVAELDQVVVLVNTNLVAVVEITE